MNPTEAAGLQDRSKMKRPFFARLLLSMAIALMMAGPPARAASSTSASVKTVTRTPSRTPTPRKTPTRTPTAKPTPNLCKEGSQDKPCYFIALRLADQRIPAATPPEQPLIDNLATHLRKLKNDYLRAPLSPDNVSVYQNDDIHISLQLLTQTYPLNPAEQAKLDRAMAAVRAKYKTTLLNMCGEMLSGKFKVKESGYIMYGLSKDTVLTGLMNSVITALDTQGVKHSDRKDFPKGGHYSVGNFDTTQSTVYKDLNKHFKPWNKGQNDITDPNNPNYQYYMRRAYCTTFIPPDLSLMIRKKNPPGTRPFIHHYRVDKSYPLQ